MSTTTSTVTVYTSETGVQSPEPTIVEHVAATKVRMTDAQYGISTGAKKVHDEVAKAKWKADRDAAIAKQHTTEAQRKAAKIASLDADIARLSTSLIAGHASNVTKVTAVRDALVAKRNALVSN